MTQVAQALARLEDTLPAMALEALREQKKRVSRPLSAQIEEIERKPPRRKEDRGGQTLMQMPGGAPRPPRRWPRWAMQRSSAGA